MSMNVSAEAIRSIRTFASYQKYKDSGIEWLGEIPEHWDTGPIRAFARSGYKTFIDGDWIESPYIREEGIRLIQTGNIGVGDYREQGFRYIDEDTFYQFRCTQVIPGDILICRLADPVGRACLAPDLGIRMVTSVDVCILKPREDVDARFVVYALSSQEYLSWMSSICRGSTRDRVSRSLLGAIRIQTPPLEEQRAIAAFLDRETVRIDALIDKKQRQIELLQEKRSALISHAVTKGLDPNVKMRDSGIKWLGEIPEHWETKRLKFISSICTGGKDTVDNVEEGQYPFYVRSQTVERISSYSYDGEAVLTAGDGVGVAKVFHYANGMFDFHQRVYKFSDFQHLSGKFFFYHIRELFREEVLKLSAKSTVDSLRLPMIQNFLFCIPTPKEQAKIVEHVDREVDRIKHAVSQVLESLNLLREYRIALISAAVTGKIDVQEEIV